MNPEVKMAIMKTFKKYKQANKEKLQENRFNHARSVLNLRENS